MTDVTLVSEDTRDLSDAILVSEGHDSHDDHNDCDDHDYHDNHMVMALMILTEMKLKIQMKMQMMMKFGDYDSYFVMKVRGA